MKLLLEIRDSDVIPGSQDLDPSSFSERQAARAVVINDVGQVALLKVSKHNYHKLPGGGIEAHEDIEQALRRELLEEIGCEARVVDEVGEIIEYKNEHQKKQTSYCYIGQQFGDSREPNFTEREFSDGFEMVWSTDIDQAIKLLENDKPSDYTGHFIRGRDLAFLKAAKAILATTK